MCPIAAEIRPTIAACWNSTVSLLTVACCNGGAGGGAGGVSVTVLFVVIRGDVRVRVLRSFRLLEFTSALCNAFNPNPLVLKYGFKFLKLVLLPLALQLLLANSSKHVMSRVEVVVFMLCVH